MLAAGTASYDWHDFEALDKVPEALRSVVDTLTGLGFSAVAESPGYAIDPTRDDLWAAVESAAAAPVVVVYYTGHGAQLERDTYYLVTKQSRPANLRRTALAARDLLRLLTRRDDQGEVSEYQPMVLVILDCCHSGSAGMEMLGEELRGIGNPNAWVISSAGALEYAQQGLFAEAFCDALQRPTTGPSQPFLSLDTVVDAINAARPSGAEQRARVFTPFTGSEGVAPILPNPSYQPGLAGLTVADQQYWVSRVRGGPEESTTGFYLTGKTGRLRAAEHLAAWMTDPGPRGLAVVTGSPGAGKSALLAMPVLLTDRSRRADLLRAAEPGSLIQRTASLLPAETSVTAVHARGLNTDQVADVIARALGREAATASGLLEQLDQVPEQRRRVILVDAVDEAASPATLLASLLVPLSCQPELQVAVGARRHVLAGVGDAGLTIDLDSGACRDPQALTDYVHRLLIASEEPGVTTAYTPGAAPLQGDRSEAAAAVAAVIAQRATGRDGGSESFLIGRLLALSARASTEPADISSERWQAELPASVAEAFDEDLARLGGKAPLARALLRALAWARGPGLPWENIWVPVARALAEDGNGTPQSPITDEHVRWLIGKAGAYVVEDLGPGGRSVYRPFHDLLAAHLRGEPNTEQDDTCPAAAGAWQQRRARTEKRITDALLATVPVDSQGRPDWPTAHPYLQTYLYQHAEAAGPETAGALAYDKGFLTVADVVTVSPVLDRWNDAVEQAWSFHNTQPWSFGIFAADRIELRLGPDPYGLDRAGIRENVISCGAALFNLRLAIRVTGHNLAVWLLPDPRDNVLLASVEIETKRIKTPTIEDQELYEAIGRCDTNESPYTIRPVPLPIIAAMEHAATKQGASLRLLNNRQARKWMRLAAKVDHDPAFKPPFPDLVSSANYGPPPKNRYPRTRKDFWLPSEKQRFERHPQLMALSTDDDEPLDWLRAGQALQRAILTATRLSVSAPHGLAARDHTPPQHGVPARHELQTGQYDVPGYGLSVSFLPQPLERDDIDGMVRRWPWRWPYAGLPQMVMRVGYAVDPTPAAPRLQPDIVDARRSR